MRDIFWKLMLISWLHRLHNDLPFLPERMKIEKVEKLVTNLHDEAEYAIWNLKQALNHKLFLEKVHRFWKNYWKYEKT